MPTSYTDQFYDMDPFSPPAQNSPLNVVTYSFIDEDDNGFIEIGDTFEGNLITGVYPGDEIRVRIPGTPGFTSITGVTFYVAGGGRHFTPIDGTILVDSLFNRTLDTVSNSPVPIGDLFPPCFTTGTLIETEDGLRKVEDLQPGDRVRTADHGLQPLLHLCRQQFPAQGKFAPVMIRAGALGNARDLRVSQEHRMVVADWRAELYVGQSEVLVAAKHLVNGRGIVIETGGRVEYIHLLFANHEIVFAEGIASESYLPSHAVKLAEADVNRETLAFFPESGAGHAPPDKTARIVARRREALLLAS